jgi:hypothetical protein
MPAWSKALGVVVVVAGGYLVFSPEVVRDVLGRKPATTSDWINLRATFGGTLVGLGAFAVWLPGLRPWLRTVLGLLLWSMAAIAAARLLGFALDGDPDRRQYIWLVAEVVLVAGSASVLHRRRGAWLQA